MLEALISLVGLRKVVPLAPAAFSPQLPEVDSEETEHDAEDFEPDLESVAGVGCIISYRDSQGVESVRRITCRKLSQRAATFYLQAYCHERAALRTFRVDRVTEVACGVTGEIFSPASTFFARYGAENEGGAAVGFGLNVQLAADLRAGLNVLAFLARADGRVVPEEEDVMATYCQSFALRFGNDGFDHDGSCRYATQLAPDAETFYVSLVRLTRDGAPQGLAQLTRRAAGQLIEADGVQHEREFHFGLKVQEYLAA
jgi:hypothetical protein